MPLTNVRTRPLCQALGHFDALDWEAAHPGQVHARLAERRQLDPAVLRERDLRQGVNLRLVEHARPMRSNSATTSS